MRVTVKVLAILPLAAGLSACGPSRYTTYEADERYRSRDEVSVKDTRPSKRTTARQHLAERRAAKKPAAPKTAAAPVRSATTAAATAAAKDAEAASKPVEVLTPAGPAAAPKATIATPAPEAPAPAVNGNVAAKPADDAASKDAKKQLEDGYRLLRAGFVKKARERFEIAMKDNAAEASLGLGRSMDPSYLKTVAFPDVTPDAEHARRLYRRAVLLGNTEAKSDLERLEKALAAAQPVTAPPGEEAPRKSE